MAPIAAVMTGPGAGAIATIELVGDCAEPILRTIFHRTDGKPFEFAAGRVFLGDILDGHRTIDQVTIGCEGADAFAIHCHGNPLIVEQIMGLLRRHGVRPVRAEQLLGGVLMSREAGDSITVEAKLAFATVKTIEGASLIANQVKGGLAAKARQWQLDLDSAPIEQIAAEARRILLDSDKARLILSGCTIALIGPPNSGKSTLLNALAGREKAIVTDIPGTTRDWVSAEIRIPPLLATIIDTAGLDPALAAAGGIDCSAQHKSLEALDRADLILLVLDASRPAKQFGTDEDVGHRGHRDHRANEGPPMDTGSTPLSVSSVPSVADNSQIRVPSLWDRLADKRTAVVLNKADLPPRLELKSLPEHLRHAVPISAKQETGIDDLIRAIHGVCGLTDFSLNTAVAFTDRQRMILRQLVSARSHGEASAAITELLHGLIM
jgi:tRNA U34 5-carboxymethylaminomethyl modifying GTPase MnmE/TrmE